MSKQTKLNLTFMSLAHLLVDAIGAAYIYKYAVLSGENFSPALLVYTLISFGLQPFLGLIADKTKKYKLMLAVSFCLMIVFGIFNINVFVNVVFLGLGNAIFHVAGGGVAIYSTDVLTTLERLYHWGRWVWLWA